MAAKQLSQDHTTKCQACDSVNCYEGATKNKCGVCESIVVKGCSTCPDPLCGKLMVPSYQQASAETCNCTRAYWVTLQNQNKGNSTIPDRKCGGCGKLCVVENGVTRPFCNEHYPVRKRPNLDTTLHCCICGEYDAITNPTFVIAIFTAICTKKECREAIKNYKF